MKLKTQLEDDCYITNDGNADYKLSLCVTCCQILIDSVFMQVGKVGNEVTAVAQCVNVTASKDGLALDPAAGME